MTESGLVRPLLRRPAGSIEQVHPVTLAVPAVREMEGEMTATMPPGGAGRDVDHVAADGGTASQAGQGDTRLAANLGDRFAMESW